MTYICKHCGEVNGRKIYTPYIIHESKTECEICGTHIKWNPKTQNQTMSNYQKKDGDISVFTNQSANANAPRWKGSLLLNGQEYSVSLWVKNGAKGEFLAGGVQPKQAPVPAPDHFNYPQSNPNSSGDLPF